MRRRGQFLDTCGLGIPHARSLTDPHGRSLTDPLAHPDR
jgi:hypothetical protein